MFLTAAGKRRKRVNKNQGFPATDTGRAAKDRLAAIELDETAAAALHELRSLPPPRFEDAQWNVLNALMLLLPLAVYYLRRVFREEGGVDFTEVAIGARNALGPDTEPTDLSHALDCEIRHLLIDEFQDTSQSQYDLLASLIRDWRPGDGRTLFLVGDPMQSIYGFREAEVGLFLQARRNGIAAVQLTPLTLSVNFRSFPAIVEWVNRALSEAFPDTEDILTGAVTYEPSKAFKAASSDSAVPHTSRLGERRRSRSGTRCRDHRRKPGEVAGGDDLRAGPGPPASDPNRRGPSQEGQAVPRRGNRRPGRATGRAGSDGAHAGTPQPGPSSRLVVDPPRSVVRFDARGSRSAGRRRYLPRDLGPAARPGEAASVVSRRPGTHRTDDSGA